MKGVRINFWFMVSVIIVLIVIMTGSLEYNKILEAKSLYDRFAPAPISYVGEGEVWIGKETFKAGSEKFIKSCKDFLYEVSTLFSYDEISRECSRWYKKCTSEIDDAPPSPWRESELFEKDLNAINYLEFDCATEEIKKLKERWVKKSTFFKEKSEFEKNNLIKNACAATIITKIYKE